MKVYLGNRKIYVKNEDNKIYVINEAEMHDGEPTIRYSMDLVCGWDYVNPDAGNLQGYVGAESFIDDVQWESVGQYWLDESLTECLTSNGYEILDKCPVFYRSPLSYDQEIYDYGEKIDLNTEGAR